jgi:hypothetical protein
MIMKIYQGGEYIEGKKSGSSAGFVAKN